MVRSYGSLQRWIGYGLVAGLTGMAILISSGCSVRMPDVFEEADGGPDRKVDLASIPNAVPRVEAKSRYGNPASYEQFGRRYYVMDSASGFRERGVASWYGSKFHGRRTSSGETYDMYKMTAAHKKLPLPTYVEVTNLENGRSVVVKVNDRGPFHQNRVIDLSYVAAAKLGIVARGTGLVEVRAIDPRQPLRADKAPKALDHKPGLFIQAGAFGNRDNALRMQTRLRNQLEQPVRISTVQQNGQQLHRVQVGPLLSVASADTVSLRLQNLGIENMRTIIE